MSKRIVWNVIATLVFVCGLSLAPATASAQGTQPPPAQAPPADQPRIRVKLLVEKLEGTKVAGSLPLEMLVRQGGQSTLNHGKSVPVQSMTTTNNGNTSYASYVYQTTGTNVAISGANVTGTLISFQLTLDISAVDSGGSTQNPLFKKYSTQTDVRLRPGEPTVVAMSTDPLTNETARLTVTAEIVK